MNVKFRRQVPIGPYIADFLCIDVKLILEIDGDSHYEDGAQEHDRKRDAFLQEKGFAVLRLSNRRVLEDTDTVVTHIVECLEELGGPSPSLAATRSTLSRGERENGPSSSLAATRSTLSNS